ncbi:uncharacterized protein Dyak_GE28006 [Drosophila yakuba]|uniref:Saposin B-type domain-containing protein n=1 Tax=Drosophila yakuba TaxID=7245 RepID=A0A0R1E7P1_DROYA|nr:uncharacterized protein Dyak_GE28006 [Drosophila yakuba]
MISDTIKSSSFWIHFLLCYFFVKGLSPDCQEIEKHCSQCLLKLNDSYNKLEVVNNGCRQKLQDVYIWEDQDLCDMLVIACELNGVRKKDCLTMAEFTQMRRAKSEL